MSDTVLTVVRAICFVSIVLNLLQATVFAGQFRRYLFDPWVAFGEKRGGRPLPPLLKDARVHRAWALLNAVLFAAAWWYLGTPEGRAWFENAWR
jgi:hypothetical protein